MCLVTPQHKSRPRPATRAPPALCCARSSLLNVSYRGHQLPYPCTLRPRGVVATESTLFHLYIIQNLTYPPANPVPVKGSREDDDMMSLMPKRLTKYKSVLRCEHVLTCFVAVTWRVQGHFRVHCSQVAGVATRESRASMAICNLSPWIFEGVYST